MVSWDLPSTPLSSLFQDALDYLPSSLELCKKLIPSAIPAVVATKADLFRNRQIETEDAVVRLDTAAKPFLGGEFKNL